MLLDLKTVACLGNQRVDFLKRPLGCLLLFSDLTLKFCVMVLCCRCSVCVYCWTYIYPLFVCLFVCLLVRLLTLVSASVSSPFLGNLTYVEFQLRKPPVWPRFSNSKLPYIYSHGWVAILLPLKTHARRICVMVCSVGI